MYMYWWGLTEASKTETLGRIFFDFKLIQMGLGREKKRRTGP